MIRNNIQPQTGPSWLEDLLEDYYMEDMQLSMHALRLAIKARVCTGILRSGMGGVAMGIIELLIRSLDLLNLILEEIEFDFDNEVSFCKSTIIEGTTVLASLADDVHLFLS